MIYPAWESMNPIIKGYSWDQGFTYNLNGSAVDLSSYDLSIEILEALDSTSVVTTLSVTGGHITLGTDGSIDIVLTTAQTAALTAGTYYYVATLTYPDTTTKYPILIGKVNVVTWDQVGS